MSDVMFVVPAFEADILNECNGTLLLATILKENGIDVDIYRYYQSGDKKSFADFVDVSVKNILAKEPKIVSFYCRGDCYLANIRVAEKIKEINPCVFIVFGGPQADISARETIERIPFVDYCCSGEGETTIYPLFSGLLNGTDVLHIRGLTYRNDRGEVVSNPRPELLLDLDELPIEDYGFIPEEIRSQPKEKNKAVTIGVGRGCPYNCAYCSTSMFWQRKFRIKSPKRILLEMKNIEKVFGVNRCVFDHDLFTANKSKVYEFCKLLKESGENRRWSCSSRADTIDKELVDEMVSSGMTAIYLGIETGSPRMQKLIHKNLNLDKTYEIIKHLLQKGVYVCASFIYGFPEETEDDLEETLQFMYRLMKLGISGVQMHLCAIFPGTEYYNTYKDQLVLSETFSDQVGSFGVAENMSFIKANKDLFPFYYEYRSELRDRFSGLSKQAFMIIEMYKKLIALDSEKFAGMRLVDLFLAVNEANKASAELTEKSGHTEPKVERICNYLATVCDKEDMEIYREVFTFHYDLQAANNMEGNHADVKIYGIDIDAVVKGKSLSEIERKPVMVYINKVGKTVSYVIKPFGI